MAAQATSKTHSKLLISNQDQDHLFASGLQMQIDQSRLTSSSSAYDDELGANELAPARGTSRGPKLLRSSSSSVSPSSLQSLTTDSDSLQGEPSATLALNSTSRNSSPSSSSSPQHRSSQVKSPILIKYNYYDYNGERQENHDLQTSNGGSRNGGGSSGANQPGHQRIQRQLSPTFKQSLDQIVKSSQKYLAQQQQHQSASPVSPRGSPNGSSSANGTNAANDSPHSNGAPNQNNVYTMTLLARRYKLSSYEHRCLRCAKTVYQMDKVGPLKDFTFYHQNCFKCRECGTKLTLKTYFNNQHSSTDQEVYCHRHCPKTPAGRLDNQSVGIRAALNAPKVFDPIHQEQFLAAMAGSNNNNNGGHQFSPYMMNHHQLGPASQQQQPQVDSRALHIQHAVKQTKLQAIYKHSQVDKKLSQFLNRRLEYLEPKQKMLEAQHREEEEQLFKVFEQKWRQEESSIRDQIREEWQRELNKLLDKYKRQLCSSAANMNMNFAAQSAQSQQQQQSNNNNLEPLKSAAQSKAMKSFLLEQKQKLIASQQKSARLDFHRLPASDAAAANDPDADEQKMIEFERMNLEKTMTIKLDRKKETLKRKLKEFERQATAELVEKQSREMITLISLKLEEFKEEQKRKIGSDLEQFEAIESLANHLGASLQISTTAGTRLSPNTNSRQARSVVAGSQESAAAASNQAGQQVLAAGAPPLPRAPQLSKMELYNSDQPDELFRDIDQLAINVAKEDQRTFTDLVHHLTRHCLTDVEKVRAVFRWITVKNLNTMEFDSSVKPDTPLGLLRGIKQGSESYHVLFKRLCSYAGLHCVVIKGYSKSAGYQPGVRFEGNRFRNSWNAVYVAGAWRFVQCNWGARHLVSVAVMQDKNNSTNGNKQHSNGRSSQAASRAPSDLTLGGHPATPLVGANLGRRGASSSAYNGSVGSPTGNAPSSPVDQQQQQVRSSLSSQLAPSSPACSSSASSSCSYSSSSSCSSPAKQQVAHRQHQKKPTTKEREPAGAAAASSSDSLRYEYDDHYFLTDPDEFIYEFFPLAPEWQLLKTRPISLQEFEQLPFVRSLFFKYGLYFPQPDIRSVLYTNSSGATTIKIGMPTHMIPSLIFHYNLKYFDSDLEHHDGVSLKRFVMQSVESGGNGNGNGSASASSGSGSPQGSESAGAGNLLSNIVSFRVHVPENGAYILDIFANSTTPNQYITGEPMKFKSVCKFKIIARNLKTVMVPLPDCASGEYGPMKATRLFGIIPLTHENGLISVQNERRFLEIQFRMTRPLMDFMASLHKNGQDERQLSKLIKIFIDGDIVFIAIKFQEDGQYGLDVYTRDQPAASQQQQQQPIEQFTTTNKSVAASNQASEPKKQLLTHCCKYLINVRAAKQ